MRPDREIFTAKNAEIAELFEGNEPQVRIEHCTILATHRRRLTTND
jgi:hypothetical protein